MKGFLIDENLPRRLTFTPSAPVTFSNVSGSSASDSQIWNYAKAKSLVIVTKDADFSDRIMLSSSPPWIIHLRIGNVRRQDFHALLLRVWPQVEAMIPANKLVCV